MKGYLAITLITIFPFEIKSQLNVVGNDVCTDREIILWPISFDTYPHLFYDIDPFLDETVYHNNVSFDLIFEDQFDGSTGDLYYKYVPEVDNRNTNQNGNPGNKPPDVISYGENITDPNQTTMEVSNGTLKMKVHEITPIMGRVVEYAPDTDTLSDGLGFKYKKIN